MKKITLLMFFLGCMTSAIPGVAEQRLVGLPEINLEEGLTVAEAIYQRRSVRRYAPDSLSLEEVSHLLWAAAGETVDGVTGPTRAYPSAGGVYPLTVYLVAGDVEGLDAGLYRYNWREHALELLREGDLRSELSSASLGQDMPALAPASVIVTADFELTARRYGDRGRDLYVPIDTGHLAQNVNLQAESMGLGCVMIGAFMEDAVKDLIEGETGTPVYVIPVGRK